LGAAAIVWYDLRDERNRMAQRRCRDCFCDTDLPIHSASLGPGDALEVIRNHFDLALKTSDRPAAATLHRAFASNMGLTPKARNTVREARDVPYRLPGKVRSCRRIRVLAVLADIGKAATTLARLGA
jgi:hypothetical protein